MKLPIIEPYHFGAISLLMACSDDLHAASYSLRLNANNDFTTITVSCNKVVTFFDLKF